VAAGETSAKTGMAGKSTVASSGRVAAATLGLKLHGRRQEQKRRNSYKAPHNHIIGLIRAVAHEFLVAKD
jgi:hypothetical protein